VKIEVSAELKEERAMANPELLEEQREETRLIIEELLEDGSDPDALYTIEHHFSADDFESLEKLAVEAFKMGYEVTEPEELEVEEGETVICCDILSEGALKAELIDAQVEQLMDLAEKFEVEYDGWGTYYEDPNGEDGDDEDDEDFVDEDDDGVRH
jgi:regulator of RNase E activity RraB